MFQPAFDAVSKKTYTEAELKAAAEAHERAEQSRREVEHKRWENEQNKRKKEEERRKTEEWERERETFHARKKEAARKKILSRALPFLLLIGIIGHLLSCVSSNCNFTSRAANRRSVWIPYLCFHSNGAANIFNIVLLF